MGSEQQFCLRWHNYQSSLLASLPLLLDGEDLTDVTLMAGGCNLKAHRVVLSACSHYFKELFKMLQPVHHPVIVLPGTKFTDLCALVTFMYSGEVNIYQEQLQGLLAMADALQIRGLAEVNGNSAKGSNPFSPVPLREDNMHSAVKRARVSASSHSKTQAISSLLQTPRSLKQKTDADVYSSLADNLKSLASSQVAVETESLSKTNLLSSESYKGKSFMKNVSSQAGCPFGTNTLSFSNDKSLATSKMSSKETKCGDKNLSLIESGVKSEDGLRILDNSVAMEIDSVLRNTSHSTLEEMELAAAKICASQGSLSPSSEPTLDGVGSGSLSVDFGSERMLVNPSIQSKQASSHYTKPWSTPPANNKLFATCFVCGKQLSNQYNLRVHMETHQNVNYACNVCSHVSRSRDALRKHVSYRHPGESKEKSEKQVEAGKNSGEIVGDGGSKTKDVSKSDGNSKHTNP